MQSVVSNPSFSHDVSVPTMTEPRAKLERRTFNNSSQERYPSLSSLAMNRTSSSKRRTNTRRTPIQPSNDTKSWCSKSACNRRALYVLLPPAEPPNASSTRNGSAASSTVLRFCAVHRPSGAISDQRPSQRCRFAGGPAGAPGCSRWPSYGSAVVRVALYCRQHAPDGLVNLKARACAAPGGCQVQASYGDPLLDRRVPSPALAPPPATRRPPPPARSARRQRAPPCPFAGGSRCRHGGSPSLPHRTLVPLD
jgi:hypothetical protein